MMGRAVRAGSSASRRVSSRRHAAPQLRSAAPLLGGGSFAASGSELIHFEELCRQRKSHHHAFWRRPGLELGPEMIHSNS